MTYLFYLLPLPWVLPTLSSFSLRCYHHYIFPAIMKLKRVVSILKRKKGYWIMITVQIPEHIFCKILMQEIWNGPGLVISPIKLSNCIAGEWGAMIWEQVQSPIKKLHLVYFSFQLAWLYARKICILYCTNLTFLSLMSGRKIFHCVSQNDHLSKKRSRIPENSCS